MLVRLGRATKDSTLLGPERTTDGPAGGICPADRVLGFQSRHNLVFIPVTVVALVGTVGLWVGRWLRIAQWTRASLFSVVKLSRANGGCLGTRSR